MIELEKITQQAQTAISEASELAALDALRVEYLGKKGQLTGLLKGLGALSAEERPAAGGRAAGAALEHDMCRTVGAGAGTYGTSLRPRSNNNNY